MCVLGTYVLVVSLSMTPQKDQFKTDAIHNPTVRFALTGAARAAARKLEGAKCRKVLSEFRDSSGRTMQENLSVLNETPGSYLRRITFREGGDAPCRDTRRLAFTNVGSREVFICGTQFWKMYQMDPSHVEVVLIHEMMHTLGLGENPPSSVEINARVRKRCG